MWKKIKFEILSRLPNVKSYIPITREMVEAYYKQTGGNTK